MKYPNPEALHGHILYRKKQYAEAEGELRAAVKGAPDDFCSYQRLTRALFHQGKLAEARAAGLTTLRLKDSAAMSGDRAANLKLRNNGCGRSFDPGAKSRNVISFGLWGDKDKYCLRAIRNAELASDLYPEWTSRFYYDESVPRDVIDRLRSLGAQLRKVSGGLGAHDRLFWRFFPSDDPQVDRFICRDCDSLLNTQERAAVEAWTSTGMPFHLMRDHINHMELILAGMWGGLAGVLPPLQTLLDQSYLRAGSRGTDQDFLRERVWPLIKSDSLVHDSYYHPEFGVDFPAHGRLTRPGHVGAS